MKAFGRNAGGILSLITADSLAKYVSLAWKKNLIPRSSTENFIASRGGGGRNGGRRHETKSTERAISPATCLSIRFYFQLYFIAPLPARSILPGQSFHRELHARSRANLHDNFPRNTRITA